MPTGREPSPNSEPGSRTSGLRLCRPCGGLTAVGPSLVHAWSGWPASAPCTFNTSPLTLFPHPHPYPLARSASFDRDCFSISIIAACPMLPILFTTPTPFLLMPSPAHDSRLPCWLRWTGPVVLHCGARDGCVPSRQKFARSKRRKDLIVPLARRRRRRRLLAPDLTEETAVEMASKWPWLVVDAHEEQKSCRAERSVAAGRSA